MINSCFRHTYKNGKDHCIALLKVDEHCGTTDCKWFKTLEEELEEEEMCRRRCGEIGVKYNAPSEGVLHK